MTNPFDDLVDYDDDREEEEYEELRDGYGNVVDRVRVGRGSCVDEFEEREADKHMSRYEKGMGW